MTVDTATSAFALPTIDNAGNLVLPALSDHVLEVLLGELLRQAKAPWLAPLADALGLGEQVAGELLSFASLFSDPRGWIVERLRHQLTDADPAAVVGNLGHLGDVLAALASAPATRYRRGPTRRPARDSAAGRTRVARTRRLARPGRPAHSASGCYVAAFAASPD